MGQPASPFPWLDTLKRETPPEVRAAWAVAAELTTGDEWGALFRPLCQDDTDDPRHDLTLPEVMALVGQVIDDRWSDARQQAETACRRAEADITKRGLATVTRQGEGFQADERIYIPYAGTYHCYRMTWYPVAYPTGDPRTIVSVVVEEIRKIAENGAPMRVESHAVVYSSQYADCDIAPRLVALAEAHALA